MTSQYLDLIAKRRTIYALGKRVDQSTEAIAELIQKAIELSPSAFNNQTTRAVILFNEHHDKLWDIVADRLHDEVPDEAAFQKTKQKIESSFKAGFGSVLYFTDTDVVKDYQTKFALYADNFPDWAEQAQGNAQFNVWTALANENIGASLQHYNPLIDDLVQKAFDIPETWRLRAQMPFGSIEAPAGDKTFMARDDRFKIFK